MEKGAQGEALKAVGEIVEQIVNLPAKGIPGIRNGRGCRVGPFDIQLLAHNTLPFPYKFRIGVPPPHGFDFPQIGLFRPDRDLAGNIS